MVLVLKVFLHYSLNGKCEVRRISTTSDFVHSYNLLCCKIAALFPDLEGKTYRLFWKDEEGDDILMSTDQELDQAVASANNDMLKIHVQITDVETNNPGSSSSDIVHTNIICDACNQVVKGHRYKCLQCEDFDLCSSCNTLEKHPAHDMVKLVSPSSISRAWFFRGWRSMWQSMFSHEGSRGGGYGHPHWHHGHRGGHHNFKKNKGGKCPWVASKANEDVLSQIGQSISSLLSPFGVEATVDVVMSDKEQEPNNTEKAEAPAFHSSGNSGSSENEKEVSAEQIIGDGPASKIRKEEEEVKSSVAASESPQQEQCSATVLPTSEAATNGTSTSQAATTDGPSTSKTAATDEPKSNAMPPLDFLTSDALSKANTLTKVLAAQMGKPKGLYATLQEAAKLLEDWTIVNAPSTAEGNETPQTEPKVVKEDPSVHKQEEVKPESKSSPTSAETPPSVSTEPPVIDPRYASALEYMLSMGFKNDGNWLSKLIQTKDGNINEVLDALYRN